MRDGRCVPAGFSVIIPVYDKENHLSRCLDSVVAQSFSPIEILIVDDNSSDRSLEIAKSYEDADSRVRVFRRETPGPGGYAARNLGLREARYDWCAFLDADDEWKADHLEVAARLIQQYPDTVLVSSAWVIDDGNAPTLDGYSRSEDSGNPKHLTLDDFFQGPRPIWTGVVRAKTSFLKEVGFFDERWRHGADVEYWLRIFLKGEGAMLWAPKASAVYHTDSDNMVTAKVSQTLSPTSEFIHRLLEKETFDSGKEKKLKRLANRYQMLPFIRSVAVGGQIKPYIKNHFFSSELAFSQRGMLGAFALMPKRFSMLVATRFLEWYERTK